MGEAMRDNSFLPSPGAPMLHPRGFQTLTTTPGSPGPDQRPQATENMDIFASKFSAAGPTLQKTGKGE